MIQPHSVRVRREDIRRELDLVETRMAEMARRLEQEVRTRANPAFYLRRHPVTAIAVSAGLGVLLSTLLGKRESRGVIKGVARSVAARWITQKVMQFVSGRMGKGKREEKTATAGEG